MEAIVAGRWVNAPWAARFFCSHCASRYRSAYSHPTLGPVCPLCLRPVSATASRRRHPKQHARRLKALGKRDLWICHLCGDDVQPDAKGHFAPTIDHVLPLSHGGGNGLDNVKLAHWICNNKRGNALLKEA